MKNIDPNASFETKCLHAGYTPQNGEPRVVPIVQSTTYCFDSSEHIAALFDMPTEFMYSRFANPTCDAVEKKIAAMEGGAAAMLTSSGQAASLLSILNICGAGDSFIAAANIYGGTVNLFGVTLKRFGIECIWVDADISPEEAQRYFKPNTKAVFGETLANAALTVFDIKKWADIAHKNNVPLIIDNTFATPYLCNPIAHGADIVVHSTTKYMDGHAVQVGGVIVDGGAFDWTTDAAKEKFPSMTEPDPTYHGVVYTQAFGSIAYIIKARMQLMRDLGVYPAAQSAFYLNLGLETLHVRMPRYCENALAAAEFLNEHPMAEKVRYPGLSGDKYYNLAKQYLPKGASGVITFSIKGGRPAAVKFMDSLELASKVVHVADIRTCVLHPASSTHRQLTQEQLTAAGLDSGMVRLSVGLEHKDDIIADIKQALDKAAQ